MVNQLNSLDYVAFIKFVTCLIYVSVFREGYHREVVPEAN